MISTFQALAVSLLALLPGASYTFTYERAVGNFGVSFTDRLIRFLSASAIFLALMSGPFILLYQTFVVTGRLERGDVPWWLVELLAIVYVTLPIIAGWVLGHGQNSGWRAVQQLLGENPEPRAWDYLWRFRVNGVVRMRLKTGTWLAGIFATNKAGQASYASGYPEECDLYLSLQLKVDPITGAFETDENGSAVPVEGEPGLLVRWAEVEYISFQEFGEEN